MQITIANNTFTSPPRANGAPAEQAAAAPVGEPGYDAKKVAFAALPFSDGPDQRQNNFDVLTQIAQKSTDPNERLVAQTVADVAAQRMYPTTAVALQSAGLEKLSQGIKAPIGTVLAEIGLKGIGAAQDPLESRVIGNGMLETIRNNSQNPTEVVLAKAARQAAGMELFNDTGARFVKAALTQIKDGVTGTPAQEVGKLGQQLPEITRGSQKQTGESCNMAMALFSSLNEATSNKTAKALTDMSTGHVNAGEGLQKVQQEAFADLAAGRESQYANPPKAEFLTSNKNAVVSAIGGAVTQLGMVGLGTAGIGGIGGILAGLALSVVAFGGTKGVYHGMMEVQARKAGPMRYNQDYVNSAFSDGFKMGFKGNIFSSLLHGGINQMAYSYLGFPASLVVGPGVSALLGKIGF